MAHIARALEKNKAPARCRFSLVREEIYDLDPEDGIAIDSAIRSGLTCNKIAKAIRTGGYKMSHSTIQAHKDKECICKGEYEWV